MKYAQHFSTIATPQSQPIPGKIQVANSAGGYVFAVDDWMKLDRFLILGTEKGSYYASEQKLTIENAQAVLRCAKQDGKRTVARIVEISESGRAPKNDPAIFALAICAGEKIPEALAAIPKVCRIGTHLFAFNEAVEKFRGRGRALNRAIAEWYTKDKTPSQVAYQLVKYQQRNGWSHRDLLRLSKPSNVSEPLNTALRWAVGKADMLSPDAFGSDHPLAHIMAFEQAKRATDKKEICRLIEKYDMPREAIPTQFLTEPSVWEALLQRMPMTAMLRNLATMTRIGLLAPMSNAVQKVTSEFANVDRLKKSRLHPLAILIALKTYAAGRSEKGSNTWAPIPQITDSLNAAFYAAFSNVEPTGKRWMLACDVSGSMGSGSVAGTSLTPREATGALALVTAKTEPNYCIMGFSSRFIPLDISRCSRLDDVCRAMSGLPFEGTDCSLPITYAQEKNIPVDVFVVLTDNETWAGRIHPSQALAAYRRQTGINAKLVVMSLVANDFSIADPNDGGMVDICGFDSMVPAIMRQFAMGFDDGPVRQ